MFIFKEKEQFFCFILRGTASEIRDFRLLLVIIEHHNNVTRLFEIKYLYKSVFKFSLGFSLIYRTVLDIKFNLAT